MRSRGRERETLTMSSFIGGSSRSQREASLLRRWKEIEALEEDEENVSEDEFSRCKEAWFVQAFQFFDDLPSDEHCWCTYYDLAWPLLEPFYSYYAVSENKPIKILWKRFTQELRRCTRCVLQYYKAKDFYATEFLEDAVSNLLAVLRTLDEERVASHLNEILCKMKADNLNSVNDSEEIVCVLFEVMRFPSLLDDAVIDSAFAQFLQYVENTYDLSLAADQCYAGVYALFFHNDQAVRRIAHRLAGAFGKLRSANHLEPIQPILQKHMHCLEFDLFDTKKLSSARLVGVSSHLVEGNSLYGVKSRPRAYATRESLWIGLKTLLGILEPPAFEEGIVERYPFFLSIVLNHASEASSVFWNALHCLKLLLEVLGYKLWIKTTFSPGVMRSTLIGQCFHTREEKMHKAIFDLFQPFLQSLEALQDGEYERQRRNVLYFLLQQVSHSRNFGGLMSKKARQIAFLIIMRGFKMDPACPPMECVHVWGPSLVECVKDNQLYDSLRQPAIQLLESIIIGDAVVFSNLYAKGSESKSTSLQIQEPFEDFAESIGRIRDDNSYLKEFKCLDKFADCLNNWICAPALWIDVLEKVSPSDLPDPFSQAILWAASRLATVYPKEFESKEAQSSALPSVACTNIVACALVWETPKGCDDGADGKLCQNSMVAWKHVCELALLLKRSMAIFLDQIQLTRVCGSWSWDPYLAEVLILLSLDSYEKIRDIGRYILAHFSKGSSLDSGLIFLCGSQASAACVISGFSYAIKLLIANTLQEANSCLQTLLFLARKVIGLWQGDESTVESDARDGGFLKQPDYEQHVQTNTDVKERKHQRGAASQQVSCILWSLLLKLINDGHAYSENPSYLTLFTRLFDILPSVFENMLSPVLEVNMYKDFVETAVRDSGTAWIFSLMKWGNVNVLSVGRRWRLAIGSILSCLRRVNFLDDPKGLQKVYDWVQTGGTLTPEMKEAIEALLQRGWSVAMKNVRSCTADVEASTLESVARIHKESSMAGLDEDITKAPGIQDVIVLSDDEHECTPADGMTGRIDTNEQLSLESDKAAAISQVHRHVHPISLQKQLGTHRTIHGKKATLESFFGSSSKKVVESSSNKIIGSSPKNTEVIRKSIEKASPISSQSVASEYNASASNKSDDLSHKMVAQKSIQSRINKVESECLHKDSIDAVLQELVQDVVEDVPQSAGGMKMMHPVARKGLGMNTNVEPKRQVIRLHVPNENLKGSMGRPGIISRIHIPRLDDWYKRILSIHYFSLVGLSNSNGESIEADPILEVPLVFRDAQHYMDVFRPLVLEEFRAQMQQSYQQLTFSDDTTGIFRLMSVEKIDDFDVGRFTGEPGADGLASSCFENDLLLLSRLPFQVSDQEVHMIGKVERQERDNKSRSVIVTLRFYLRSGNKRLAKARTLLLERSKWHVTRLMSITPQIREFQAVSAVARLPLLPLILNDKSCKVRPLDAESGQQLNHMLPDKLHDQLKAEYNTSQMKSIYMALKSGAIANDHEMSLVQGPPGTGKTRTIVAIISALVASMKGSKGVTDVSIPDTRGYPRKPVKESVAIARSWQAAALAKQQMQVEASEMIQKERGKGVRILVCAQSNAAVDELVHRIRKHGLYNTSGCSYQPSIVRVGNARTVHPNSLPVFIDTLVERQMQADKENVDGNASKSHTELVRNKLRKILDSVQVLESRLSKLQWTDMQSKSAAQDPVSEIDDVEADLRLEMRALYKQRNQTYRELTELEAGERRALEVAKSKRVELKRDIIRQAEIVLATLNVCGGDVYSACIDKSSGRRQHRNPNDGLFDAVIIDEAAQALEPATLIPLQLLKTSRAKCIMVGDPKQLPATIISQRATKFSFECSLFERLQKGGHPVSLLNVQYRMHPEICCFPSAHFYDGQLESGNGLLEKRKAMFHENKFLGPYAVFDVVDGYERVGHQSASQSLCNEAEAEMVLELFSYLRARYPQDVNAGRVGIITPYQQQLSLLKEQFRRSLGRTVTEGIEFNTVDGFQGREVDIIIFSTVRAMRSAQSSCRIGFVADVRRMNVAITRARFSLWIVCNASTLQGSPSWAALLKNARNRGLIQQVRRPYKVAFENENLKEHIELSISAPVVSLLSCRKSSPQEHDTKANTEAVIEKKVQESSTSSLKMLNSGCLNLVSNIDKREGNLEIKSGYSCSRNGSELRKGKVLDEVGSKNLSNSYRASSIPSLKALENKSKKSMKSGSDARHPESVIHKKPCYEKEFQGLEGSKVFLEQENLGQHVCDTHSGSKHQNATYGEERSAGVQVLEELQQHDRTGHHNQLKSTCSEKNFEQETNLSKDRDTSRFLKSSSDISDPDNNKIKGKRNRSVAVHARDSRVSQPFGSDCKVKILSTGPGVADDEIIDTLTHTWPEKNDKYSELSRPPKRIRRDFVAGSTFAKERQNCASSIEGQGTATHAENYESGSNDLIEEWQRFLQVLSESKIRFPVSNVEKHHE